LSGDPSVITPHLSRIDHWMRLVRSMNHNSKDAIVYLVGTHGDHPSLSPHLTDWVLQMMRHRFPRYCFRAFREVFVISSRTGMNIAALKDELVSAVLNNSNPLISRSWVNLHDYVKNMHHKHAVIDWQTYTSWASVCGIEEKELRLATEFLVTVGSIIYFDDKFEQSASASSSSSSSTTKTAAKPVLGATATSVTSSKALLSDLIILQPQWLTEVMACVVTFRHTWIKEGMLPVRDINKVQYCCCCCCCCCYYY
jgi:hypothetical protein